MTAHPILLQKKYARIVACYAERTGLSLSLSLKKFYHSSVYTLMSQGISDMHCMTFLFQETLNGNGSESV